MNYAIIEASGKQFWVEPGRFYDFNYLPLEPGSSIIFNKVLLSNQNGEINIGSPCLEQVKIKATILRHLSGKKVIIYKDKPKKQARSKRGYRPSLTRILINSIINN
uniref:ribosomal protein L21 n=1 Tax=Rhodella violacea TaxID=2801 RepID=UPI001FCD1B6B|nr:ribosomal protein L21 [Rhodella violacea]UNJ18059.1 ribosomal protein L21 [Rhodella violacea]|mmetsp:Transcript_17285/g.44124  ORF Transcript_17285/g.44124 Transcript_17285/m.44124 type:complete len:106 (+) Transcript_17285:61-378(+)